MGAHKLRSSLSMSLGGTLLAAWLGGSAMDSHQPQILSRDAGNFVPTGMVFQYTPDPMQKAEPEGVEGQGKPEPPSELVATLNVMNFYSGLAFQAAKGISDYGLNSAHCAVLKTTYELAEKFAVRAAVLANDESQKNPAVKVKMTETQDSIDAFFEAMNNLKRIQNRCEFKGYS